MFRISGDKFLAFNTKEDEANIVCFDGGDVYKSQVSPSSTFIVEWSKILKLTPAAYFSQLCAALDERWQHLSTQDSDLKTVTPDDTKAKDIFELNSNIFSWKQFFPENNIYGNKGRFKIEKVPSADAYETLFTTFHKMLAERECKIKGLEDSNRTLTKEHADALVLAEKSVEAQEKSKEELYGKFCSLLNSKKRKIAELEQATGKGKQPSKAVPMSNNGDADFGTLPSKALKPTLSRQSSDSEFDYEDDTDTENG